MDRGKSRSARVCRDTIDIQTDGQETAVVTLKFNGGYIKIYTHVIDLLPGRILIRGSLHFIWRGNGFVELTPIYGSIRYMVLYMYNTFLLFRSKPIFLLFSFPSFFQRFALFRVFISTAWSHLKLSKKPQSTRQFSNFRLEDFDFEDEEDFDISQLIKFHSKLFIHFLEQNHLQRDCGSTYRPPCIFPWFPAPTVHRYEYFKY